MKPEDRLNALGKQLIPSQLEEVAYVMGAPHEHFARNTSQVERAIELLRWAESNDRLEQLDATIQQLLSPPSNRASKATNIMPSGLENVVEVEKRDDALWLRHLSEAGLKLTAGVPYTLEINGTVIEFVPMKPSPDGRPTPGLKAEGLGAEYWHSLPKGTQLRVRSCSG